MTTTRHPVPTATPGDGTGPPPPSAPGPKGHIGWVVTGSLTTGLLAALLLVAAPFVPADEARITGAVLCGFAVGWAMLALLSVRFTDQPQTWAAVPAAFMGLGGLLLLVFGSSVDSWLSWVWPPALLVLVVWMFRQAHRHLRSRTRRWLLYPVFAMLAVAAVGGFYETVSAATDSPPAMPGQAISVGGHSMHLHCTGTGSPTVVLQPGGGEMSSNMGWIEPRVAANTRVCVYDRPGRGWSDPVKTAQDASQIATDLHTLLQRANVPGPYVLAGHSFGGLYVLTYADRYPDQVAGIVVIDTTAPHKAQPATSSGAPNSYDPLDRVATLISTSARLGLTRLEASAEGGGLPPQSSDGVRATIATGSNLRSFVDEFGSANSSMAEAGSFQDFGAKPLVVLTAGVGSDATLIASHERIAGMSTNSVHRVVKGAAHEDLIADRTHSKATTTAILDVVSALRNSAQLSR